MVRILNKVIISAILMILTASAPAGADHIFLLKESLGRLDIERVDIDDGETLTFEGGDVLTAIVPLGIGQSGDLVKGDMRGGVLTVSSEGGVLHISKSGPGGKDMAFPPVKIEGISTFDVRVNVSGGDGTKKAFMIKGYSDWAEDDGPVIDMFAGMIPLEDGDYSITLEISAAQADEFVSGTTDLLYEKGFLLAEGRLGDGRRGWFIVDFGASGTLVTKDFLPSYVEIEEVKGIEYSGEGRREVRSAMHGAGGEVTAFLGNAQPGDLVVGGVTFPDVTIQVIESMPDFGDRDIVGILGLDLMRLCDRISFEYPRGESGIMTMGERHMLAETDAPTAEVPFHIVAKHIFFDGEVNERPVSFLFDTGARSSILSESIAGEAGLAEVEGAKKGELRGLDDNPVESTAVVIDRMTLGQWVHSEVPILAADLSVFLSLGLRQGGGIIGNDFLDDFRLVEVDFERESISLWK